MRKVLRDISQSVVEVAGTVWASLIAVVLVLSWLFTGLASGFSERWFSTVNTIASLTTFLMVFFIQQAQNRESKAVQIKLNELIRVVEGARTDIVAIESGSDERLADLQNEFTALSEAELAENGNTENKGAESEDAENKGKTQSDQ